MHTLYHFSECAISTKTKHLAFTRCYASILNVQIEIYWIPDGVAVTVPVRPLTVPSSVAEME